MNAAENQILRTAIGLLGKLAGMKPAPPTVNNVYYELELMVKQKVKKLGFNPDSVCIKLYEEIEDGRANASVMINYAGYYVASGYSTSLQDATEEATEAIKNNTLLKEILQTNTDLAVTWLKEQGSEIAAETEIA